MIPVVTTASIIKQSPGAEDLGGVCLLCVPEPGPGRFTALTADEDRDLAALVRAVAERPGWHVVLAALLVHPTDSRPTTFGRMAVAALEGLPEGGVPCAWEPNGAGLAAAFPFGAWALRQEEPAGKVVRPIRSRVQAWRSAIGGSGYYDLVLCEAWRHPPDLAPDAMASMQVRLTRAAITQALACAAGG